MYNIVVAIFIKFPNLKYKNDKKKQIQTKSSDFMPIENKANKLDYKMNWLYKSNYTHIDSVAFNATNVNNIAKQKQLPSHVFICPNDY